MKTPPELTQLFQALADPTRLEVLNLLRGAERCASEIHSALRMSQPRVARHLKILVDAGLLRARRDGRFVRYALVREGIEGELGAAVLRSLPAAAPAEGPGRRSTPPAVAPNSTPASAGSGSPGSDDDRDDRPGAIEDFLL